MAWHAGYAEMQMKRPAYFLVAEIPYQTSKPAPVNKLTEAKLRAKNETNL